MSDDDELDPEMARRARDTLKAMCAVMDAVGKKRGVTGSMDCPACEGGKISYGVSSYNGHTSGACSTPGCLSWIE